MKKFMLLCLAACLIFTLTACDNGENNMSSENAVRLPAYDKEAYKPVAQEWKTRADSILQAKKIDKIEYACYNTGEYQVFSSQDSTLVSRWKTLIQKFKWTVVPFELYEGSPPGVLTFYEGDNPVRLLVGYTVLGRIQLETGQPDAMLQIENSSEVGEEYIGLLMAMGVPSPYVTE